MRCRFTGKVPYVPPPLVYRDIYYMARAPGELLKQGRSQDALGEYYDSPVAADGKIFLSNADGKITVLKAEAEWEVLRVNDLDEEVHTTPALTESRIYVRTRETLYCFGTAGISAR